MGFVKARGSNFYYEEQGDGPPILLIPPAGSTASTWGALPGDLAVAGATYRGQRESRRR
jgi:pimeloyl-ACP methyl ester carboxylesterase